MATQALPPLKLRPSCVVKGEAKSGVPPTQLVAWAEASLLRAFQLCSVQCIQRTVDLGGTNIILFHVGLRFEAMSNEVMLTNLPVRALEQLDRYVGQPFQLTDHVWLPFGDYEWTWQLRLEHGSARLPGSYAANG